MSARPFLLAGVFLVAASPGATQRLETDVEMSEWGPPAAATLDLASGRYAIVAPAAGWPRFRPRPRPRRGSIGAAPLARVRQTFDRALAAGLANPACVAVDARGYPPIISNGGVPRMMLAAGDRTATGAAQLTCWTPAAMTLQRLVEDVVAGLPCGQADTRRTSACTIPAEVRARR